MMHVRWRVPGTLPTRVKRPGNILETPDPDGKLDGLPFMPGMVTYCGAWVRAHRWADRTCVVGHGFRRMREAVFLQDPRCDGTGHDGCDRGCLLFWKMAWLTPAAGLPAGPAGPAAPDAPAA